MTSARLILIHGSWHWGGCFQKVADQLGASGIPVSTPDLVSHGYDGKNWRSVASMADYVAPVTALISRSPKPVILVGHSMGGAALSYLAETIPDKIAALVYLTAFMSRPAKTANDWIFSYAEDPVAASLFKILKPVDGGAGLELDMSQPDAVKDAFYGDCSDVDVAIAARNATVVNTIVPNLYTPGSVSSLPRHYITCTNDHAIPLSVQHKMIEEIPGATIHSLPTGHSPFFSAPESLADLLSTIFRQHEKA